MTLSFDGKDVDALDNEAGGHRIQRVPPTERRGRVHTSTVTVAVLDRAAPVAVSVPDSDLAIEWFSGTGKGGQHRNKHQNCCRVTHIPTGLVRSAHGRERVPNLRNARAAIEEALAEAAASSSAAGRNATRKEHVGSGMRGDKRRTYRFQEDRVTDHITGRSASCREVLRGAVDRLW